MIRILGLATLLATVLVAACERTPRPVLERSIERGTALPPPDLAAAPHR